MRQIYNTISTRIIIASVLLIIQCAHFSRNDASENWTLAYFSSLQLADLFIIFLLVKYCKGKGLMSDLFCINLAAIVLNFYGFICYIAYQPPEMYNAIIDILTFAQWARLIWIWHDDSGFFASAIKFIVHSVFGGRGNKDLSKAEK